MSSTEPMAFASLKKGGENLQRSSEPHSLDEGLTAVFDGVVKVVLETSRFEDATRFGEDIGKVSVL
jgi:hypothetical protein